MLHKSTRPSQELPDSLRDAEEAGHLALVRLLFENILDEFPDHGTTLIRYTDSLIELSLYDDAASVLDHALAVVPSDYLHLVYAQRGHRLADIGDFHGAEEQPASPRTRSRRLFLFGICSLRRISARRDHACRSACP